jgi:hypothetical protein
MFSATDNGIITRARMITILLWRSRIRNWMFCPAALTWVPP